MSYFHDIMKARTNVVVGWLETLNVDMALPAPAAVVYTEAGGLMPTERYWDLLLSTHALLGMELRYIAYLLQHYQAFPSEYTHHLCGKWVTVRRTGTRYIVQRVAIVDGTAYALRTIDGKWAGAALHELADLP